MFLPSSLSSNIFNRYKKAAIDSPKRRNRLGGFQSVCTNRQQDCDLDKEVNSKNNISNYLKYEKLRYYTNILTIFPVLPESVQRLLEKATTILENNEQTHIQEVNTLCGILKNEYEMKLIQYNKPKTLAKASLSNKKPNKSSLKIFHRILNRPHLSVSTTKEAPILKSSEIFSKNTPLLREGPKIVLNSKKYKERKSLMGIPFTIKETVQDSFSSFANVNGKIDEEIQHNSNDSLDSNDDDYKSMLNLTSDVPIHQPKRKCKLRFRLPALKINKKKNSNESKSKSKDDEHFGKWTLYSNDSDKFC